jgi:hypothetical protein
MSILVEFLLNKLFGGGIGTRSGYFFMKKYQLGLIIISVRLSILTATQER